MANDNEISDLKYQLHENERVLGFLKMLSTELEEIDADTLEVEIENKSVEIDDCIVSIKDNSYLLANNLWEQLSEKIIADLKTTKAYSTDGEVYDSLWHELCTEYQSNGSMLRGIWIDTINSIISNYLNILPVRKRLALKLTTSSGQDWVNWWKVQPNEAPKSIKKIEQNIDFKEVIDELRGRITNATLDENI